MCNKNRHGQLCEARRRTHLTSLPPPPDAPKRPNIFRGGYSRIVAHGGRCNSLAAFRCRAFCEESSDRPDSRHAGSLDDRHQHVLKGESERWC